MHYSITILPILVERFGGDTASDISNILNGMIELKSYEQQNDGNFTYRISWDLNVFISYKQTLENNFWFRTYFRFFSISTQMYQFIVNIKFLNSALDPFGAIIGHHDNPNSAITKVVQPLAHLRSTIRIIPSNQDIIQIHKDRLDTLFFKSATVRS